MNLQYSIQETNYIIHNYHNQNHATNTEKRRTKMTSNLKFKFNFSININALKARQQSVDKTSKALQKKHKLLLKISFVIIRNCPKAVASK